ncbi:MAG TPA: hypothetical protein VFQ53_27715 [Kofleriaceae bacterium]|nr:hypothetical protein [Kofleriaceae bacterium]
MRLLSASSLVPCSLLLVGLAACNDDPPAPSEVRARITDDLGNVLHETETAMQSSSESLPGNGAFSLLGRFVSTSDTTTTTARLRTKLARLVAPRTDVRTAATTTTIAADGESATDALIRKLNEELFTDANYVGDGIYNVPPELVCMTETVADDGTITETLDQECADNVVKAELRVRVAEDGDALALAIQLDANHDEPLVFTLTHTSLAVTIDLDDANDAIAALAPVFGETAPNASLAGQVTSKIEVLGAAHAKISSTIDRAIAVAFADTGVALDGPDAFRFTSAKANVFALELDGNAKAASAVVGIGATTAHVPGERDYDLDLPGISAVAMYSVGQPLQLTNLGLGDRTTTMSIDGQRAVAIDLNPDAGRAFGATITGDPATGSETIAVAPKLDLHVALDHAVLQDEPPVYDVTQILLDGSLRSSDASDQIEVLSGTFAIATNPAQYGFSATAGQCVSSTSVQDPSGAFYDQFSVGACN